MTSITFTALKFGQSGTSPQSFFLTSDNTITLCPPPSTLCASLPSRASSPEPLGLVVQGPRVTPVGGLVQLGQQGLAGLLAGVVGELDGDGLGGAGRLLTVQALDGLLSLYPLIKADEAHAPGAACGASTSQRHTPLLLHRAWGGPQRGEQGFALTAGRYSCAVLIHVMCVGGGGGMYKPRYRDRHGHTHTHTHTRSTGHKRPMVCIPNVLRTFTFLKMGREEHNDCWAVCTHVPLFRVMHGDGEGCKDTDIETATDTHNGTWVPRKIWSGHCSVLQQRGPAFLRQLQPHSFHPLFPLT